MWEVISAFERVRDRAVSIEERVQEKQRRTSGLRTAFSVRDTRAKWETHGEYYLRAYGGLKGALVKPPRMSRELAALIEAAAPALAEAFDVGLGTLAASAWSNWPKRSGYSRSMIHVAVQQISETQFVGTVSSDAPYTTFIEGNPAGRWINEPGKLLAAKIARDVPFGIAARFTGKR